MKALVCGAGGFIGHHLVDRLKKDGYWVRGVDIKRPQYSETKADHFIICDLTNQMAVRALINGEKFNEVYQVAAEMGGAGYVFTGRNDANILHNSASINLNILNACYANNVSKVFFSSSVCMYPTKDGYQDCRETAAYPANPDSEYGWEKIFSERLYMAYRRNFGMQTHIARFQNTYGPETVWEGARAKAPAALCRKVALAENGGDVEVWGDGLQRRSFVFIDDVVEGIMRLMRSDFPGPVNIGSDRIVTIGEMVELIADIAGKKIKIKYVEGPVGPQDRGTSNQLIREKLGWAPSVPLYDGLYATYDWVLGQIRRYN